MIVQVLCEQNIDCYLEQAELVNRLMIDTEMTEKDIKIGLCLINYLLQKMQEQEKTRTD